MQLWNIDDKVYNVRTESSIHISKEGNWKHHFGMYR